MILATVNSNQSAPAESFAVAPPTVADPPVSPATSVPASCRLQLTRVVSRIESPEVREIVRTIFQDILRLIECLGLIENHLRQIDAAEETFALFQLIHDEARALVDFIREDALSCSGMGEDLCDTLDGIAFAVNHDLQRVFESTQPDAISDKTTSPNTHAVLGQLYRAHDILTNCLQQSTIALAMMFDTELVGARLFNNSDMRYRQSLQLCQDLSELIQLIDTAAKASRPGLANLIGGIEKFRNESMECLMYSDWPQFESFCEKIKVAATSSTVETVLHQFRCYLETLLGQVRMRAVLANVFPVQFGAEERSQLAPARDDNSFIFSAAVGFSEENSSWNMLALAV